MTWAVFCLAVLALALIAFPIAAVLQRRQPKRAGSRMARTTAWFASAAVLAGLVMLVRGMENPTEVVFGLSPALRAGLAVWTIGAVLSLILAGYTWLAWRRSWWRLAGRVCLTLVCIAALGTAVWLNHWNLLAWPWYGGL